MENVQQEPINTRTDVIGNKKVVPYVGTYQHPLMTDLFGKFFKKIRKMSSVDKINQIYTNTFNKKPNPDLKPTKMLDLVLYEQEFGKKIRDTKEKVKKGYKFPSKLKRFMKRSTKDKELILILYLTQRGDLIPMLIPIWSGNMVIIKSKPYEVDPRAFYMFGKTRCMIFKEIDRRPVSNLDYDEIKARGDSTHSDEFLIKASMRAFVGGVKKPINKKMIFIIGAIVLGAIIFFMSQGS